MEEAKIVTILKPGKDSSSPKSFCPISLLCVTYKLYEQLILTRMVPIIDPNITEDQAGFRPGRSCTGQLLNLTEHIEDGFQKGLVTGAVFVDLCAACDTVLETSLDDRICKIMCIYKELDERAKVFVKLDGSKSRWKRKKNGLPQGSVLAPLMFNVYTNDQLEPLGIQYFIYADDLGLISQRKTFEEVEKNLSTALEEITAYYTINHLKPNPTKTQVYAFHQKNRFSRQQLNIK